MTANNRETIAKRNNAEMLVVQSETAVEENINFFIDKHDMLLDIKILMSDFYVATFTENGKSLQIAFNNGQKFRISIEACV